MQRIWYRGRHPHRRVRLSKAKCSSTKAFCEGQQKLYFSFTKIAKVANSATLSRLNFSMPTNRYPSTKASHFVWKRMSSCAFSRLSSELGASRMLSLPMVESAKGTQQRQSVLGKEQSHTRQSNWWGTSPLMILEKVVGVFCCRARLQQQTAEVRTATRRVHYCCRQMLIPTKRVFTKITYANITNYNTRNTAHQTHQYFPHYIHISAWTHHIISLFGLLLDSIFILC